MIYLDKEENFDELIKNGLVIDENDDELKMELYL